MILCSTCCNGIAEPGSRRCVECSTGRPAGARTSVLAPISPLPEVPQRIETAKRAILELLDELGRAKGAKLAFALGPQLRPHFASAAAELVAEGLVRPVPINSHERAYELVPQCSSAERKFG